MLSSVSAVASVANLGVSVAGFAVVLTKLYRMDGKLDAILKDLDAVKEMVRETNFTLDAVQLSELRTAADCLADAESSSDAKNRRRLLSDAAVMFRKQRHYYAQLLERAALWERDDVPVSAIVEAHARFVAVAMGELQAVFLQGDMGAYLNAVRTIASQHAPFARLDAAAVLRARSEAGLRRGVEEQIRRITPDLASELSGARALLLKDHARVVTMTADADFVEGNRLDSFEWFAEQKRRAPGIAVLVAPRYSLAV